MGWLALVNCTLMPISEGSKLHFCLVGRSSDLCQPSQSNEESHSIWILPDSLTALKPLPYCLRHLAIVVSTVPPLRLQRQFSSRQLNKTTRLQTYLLKKMNSFNNWQEQKVQNRFTHILKLHGPNSLKDESGCMSGVMLTGLYLFPLKSPPSSFPQSRPYTLQFLVLSIF